jgi:hypothetical protein
MTPVVPQPDDGDLWGTNPTECPECGRESCEGHDTPPETPPDAPASPRLVARSAAEVMTDPRRIEILALDVTQIPRPSWRRLDAADLPNWPCEPLRPIVDGILARGNLGCIVAETQTGKTLLGLYLARKFLDKGLLFGKFKITPVQRVMYFVLEDPPRRIQERLLDTSPEFPALPDRGRLVCHTAPGFSLADESMWHWFEECIATDRPDVVFIDTYQKATPGINSFDDAVQSPLLHKLADLTRRLDITILIIDHVRKRPTGANRASITIDDLKGTGGKAQNCDVVILMERTKNRQGITFQSFSKDFDVPVRIELRVAARGSPEAMKFTYVQDVTPALGNRSRGRARILTYERILDALPTDVGHSTSTIAKNCGVSTATMRRELARLLEQRKVVHNGRNGRGRLYRRNDTGIADNGADAGTAQ